MVQEVRELFPQVRVTEHHAQMFGCPACDVFCSASAHHSEVVHHLSLREGPSWSSPQGSRSSLGLSTPVIVFTVASVMGATQKEVNCATAFVQFPLARAPMILEALPAGCVCPPLPATRTTLLEGTS